MLTVTFAGLVATFTGDAGLKTQLAPGMTFVSQESVTLPVYESIGVMVNVELAVCPAEAVVVVAAS